MRVTVADNDEAYLATTNAVFALAASKNIQAEAKRLERDNNRLRLELTGASSLAQRNADEVALRHLAGLGRPGRCAAG